MTEYQNQKEYFEHAYDTGSDIWTKIPLQVKNSKFLDSLKPDSMILDIGAGRGSLTFELANMGFKVIGIDYVKKIVDRNNEEVKNHGLAGKVRFMEGDVLDISFQDASFDAVVDVGLLQHLKQSDWQQYESEIARVLKQGGLFLNISLSRETASYLSWFPKGSTTGNFEFEDVNYYFFTNDEIRNLFQRDFEIIDQEIEHVKNWNHEAAFAITLMKHK